MGLTWLQPTYSFLATGDPQHREGMLERPAVGITLVL